MRDYSDKDWLSRCRYESTDLEWWLMGAFLGVTFWAVVYRFLLV